MNPPLNRRDLLKLFSTATLAVPLALPAPGTPKFFSKDEFALLDALTELLIPKDDHSPGAHDAAVAEYIDKITAEAFVPEDRESWRKGLAAVNQISQSMHDKIFLSATPAQQSAVLLKMSSSERKEKTEAEKFFGQLKNTTVFAYYSTSIGIHQEIEYKGNCLLEKFVGYLPTDELPPLSSL